MTRTTFAILMLAIIIAAGCAQYSWSSTANAPRDEADAIEERVAVQTVSANASDGLEVERLTREFVLTLQEHGMRGARWSQVSGEGYVECVVSDSHISGFGSQWSASARVDCNVQCRGDFFQLERRGQSLRSGTRRAEDIASEYRSQAGSAARRALRRSAVAIAGRCGY